MPAYYVIYIFSLLGLELSSAIMACRLYRRSWLRHYKLLAALQVVTICVEISISYAAMRPGFPTAVYAWFTPVETWVYLYFLGMTQSGKLLRRVPVFFAVSMVILQSIYLSLSLERSVVFEDLYLVAYYNLLLLLAACCSLVEIVGNAENGSIFDIPVFWLAAGMLGYSSIASVLQWAGIASSMPIFVVLNAVGNVFMYGGVIICFLKYSRLQRTTIKCT